MSRYLTLVPIFALRKRGFIDTPDTRHREVMSLFGTINSETPRSDASILFRVEQRGGHPQEYLVLSELRPTNLPFEAQQPIMVNYPVFNTGTALTFRVALNAVKRTKASGSSVEPIAADVYEETSALREWLDTKLPFFTHIQIINHKREILTTYKGTKTIQIDYFDGAALVEDGIALKQALENGIGREKSYGCGLLTVKRI